MADWYWIGKLTLNWHVIDINLLIFHGNGLMDFEGLANLHGVDMQLADWYRIV